MYCTVGAKLINWHVTPQHLILFSFYQLLNRKKTAGRAAPGSDREDYKKREVIILTGRLLNRHEACHKTKKCSYVLDKYYARAIKHDMLGNLLQ